MRKRQHSESGAAFLEFAVTALFFFSMCILLIDVMRFSLQTVNAQFVVNRVLRRVILQSRDVSAIETMVINQAEAIGVRGLTADKILVCVVRPSGGCTAGVESAGSGRDLIAILIRYPFEFTFWDMGLEVTGEALSRNEPF